MKQTVKGKYTPKHPEKYVGDIRNITYRSSWEREFCLFLDNNPNVLKWASEEIAIPYIKPTDNKIHKYYPDFWMEYRNKAGDVVQEIVELKPKNQVEPPKRTGKRKQTQLYEAVTYAINIAKWKAAQDFCNKYGMKFRIVSETSMFK